LAFYQYGFLGPTIFILEINKERKFPEINKNETREKEIRCIKKEKISISGKNQKFLF
jgi:hypothetical protein